MVGSARTSPGFRFVAFVMLCGSPVKASASFLGGESSSRAHDGLFKRHLQVNPNLLVETDEVCMEEAAGFNLGCTANDISLATVTVLSPNSCIEGETFTMNATAEMYVRKQLPKALTWQQEESFCSCVTTAAVSLLSTYLFRGTYSLLTAAGSGGGRHDIGIWFATDGDPNGDGAKNGTCTVISPPNSPAGSFVDLDGPTGADADLCGDISGDTNPLLIEFQLTLTCKALDGSTDLNVPYCSSWRQPGGNDICNSPVQAFPGSPV